MSVALSFSIIASLSCCA
ncbi:hypothetical protein VCHC40A1_3206, partial [Vibrio cholerae HC-40A1]